MENKVIVDIQFKKIGYHLQPTMYGVVLDVIPKIGDHFFIDRSLCESRISDLVEWANFGDEDCKKEYSSLNDELLKIEQDIIQAEEKSLKDELKEKYKSTIRNFIAYLDDAIEIWKYNKVVAVHRRIENNNRFSINVVLGEDIKYGEEFIG